MAAQYDQLKIYTLGKFRIQRGESLLAGKSDRPQKRWLFFQLLITHKDTPPPREQILDWLDLNDNVNPWNALKSLVYYLRQALLDGDSSDAVERKYIVNHRGLYLFNREIDYWLDAEVFEEHCKRADQLAASGEHEEAIDIYRKAFELYQGDYLMEVGPQSWVARVRTRYRRLYQDSVKKTIELLVNSDRYEEAWDLCEQGLEFSPLEEELHKLSIWSLLDAGRPGLARIQYEEAVSIFQNHDLELSADLKELGETITTIQDSTEDPRRVLKELKSRDLKDGALECGVATFTTIYELEKRRNERRGEPAPHLIHLLIESGESSERIDRGVELLGKILKNNLRKGDVICAWSKRHIVLLLTDINVEQMKKVVERIQDRFDDLSTHSELRLKIRSQLL